MAWTWSSSMSLSTAAAAWSGVRASINDSFNRAAQWTTYRLATSSAAFSPPSSSRPPVACGPESG